jgi:mono/diheme cytochrome c family protein
MWSRAILYWFAAGTEARLVVRLASDLIPDDRPSKVAVKEKINKTVGRDCLSKALSWYSAAGVWTLLLITTPAALAAGDVHHGEAIFMRYCQGCHGPDGKGGGKGFMPHVGPLAKKDYIEYLPDEYLAEVISEGGAAVGKSGFMPSWKTTLPQQDIADVIAFIRTFVID